MARTALAAGHAREYETIYILRPNLEKEKAEKVATRLTDAISEHQGRVTEAELWGQRRLAYPIKKHHRGIYVYLKYLGRGDMVAEMERQLRLDDSVIRYQTVLLNNDVVMTDQEPSTEALNIDFAVEHEPDAPELPIERELGLIRPERTDSRRRDRREPRDDDESKAPAAEATAAAPTEAAAPAAAEAEATSDATTKEEG